MQEMAFSSQDTSVKIIIPTVGVQKYLRWISMGADYY